MADGADKRAVIGRTNGQTIHVTDVETGRTCAITLRGHKAMLECEFPKGMVVQRGELVDEVPAAGVESECRPA